jgi:hypothetical protein
LVLKETVGGLKGYSLGSETEMLNLPFCKRVRIVRRERGSRRDTHGIDGVLRALHDDLPEEDVALFGELDLSAWHGVGRHLTEFLRGALVASGRACAWGGIAYGNDSLVGHDD